MRKTLSAAAFWHTYYLLNQVSYNSTHSESPERNFISFGLFLCDSEVGDDSKAGVCGSAMAAVPFKLSICVFPRLMSGCAQKVSILTFLAL